MFAVQIYRRDGGARARAVVLEAVGIGLTALTWIVTAAIGLSHARDAATSPDAGASYSVDLGGDGGRYVGIALSVLLIVFLSMRDSKRWCDR